MHPEPYEYVWLAVDRAIFGDDIARAAGDLPPWLVELLQIDYACFYAICIAAVVLARCSGVHAFDRAVLLVVGGFLGSYLGYLLWPTIAPKLVLGGVDVPVGLGMTSTLRSWIDGAEANSWDCFPSGHTWLTITSLIVMWRWCRRAFWLLLLPSGLLIASTMLLHYHWASDVAAGIVCAWPCARLCDRLADADGWPAARP